MPVALLTPQPGFVEQDPEGLWQSVLMVSILFTSSEIEETQTLADRALVLCQGRIAAEFQHHELTDEALFAAASPLVTTGATS